MPVDPCFKCGRPIDLLNFATDNYYNASISLGIK